MQAAKKEGEGARRDGASKRGLERDVIAPQGKREGKREGRKRRRTAASAKTLNTSSRRMSPGHGMVQVAQREEQRKAQREAKRDAEEAMVDEAMLKVEEQQLRGGEEATGLVIGP